MFKWLRTAVGWVHLIWMSLAGVIAVILTSVIVQKLIWDRSDFKQWDVLAFMGSVIGGIITWIGVRATIKHSEKILSQEKKGKEIDAAPQKTRILDRIASTLESLEQWYPQQCLQVTNNRNQEYIRAIIDSTSLVHPVIKIREVVDESIGVDARTYMVLLDLEKLVVQAERRHRFLLSLVDHGGQPIESVVDEIIRTLMMLHHKTEQARSAVLDIRRYYLRLLFPDDPNIFDNS